MRLIFQVFAFGFTIKPRTSIKGIIMKKCPYCAEEIKDEAILCRYCKSGLSKEPAFPESEQKLFCPNCNSRITIGDTFCSHCGEEVRKEELGSSSIQEYSLSERDKGFLTQSQLEIIESVEYFV
jgi:predicted amidophosphoribosyltransferase